MKRTLPLSIALALALFLFAAEGLLSADNAQAAPAAGGPATVSSQQNVIKFSPNLPASAFNGRPNTDVVEMPDGRRVKLGDIRRLKDMAKRLRATPPGSKLPNAFRTRPAATGTPINNAADLSAALKRPDTDTVVLPSGRRVTVGMIRQFQPQVEKRIGRPLAAGAKPPDRSGPAIKIDKKTDWKAILAKPDATVLEAPNGSRITVRELRQALAAAPSRRSPPAKR
jgi:hypothetical protein